MQRRRLLALVGSLAAGSGCTGSGDDPSVDSTVTPAPVPTAGGTRTPTLDGDVQITAAMVQPGVVTAGDDSLSVVDDAGQYLFFNLEGGVPDRSAVEFRFSGASYTPESFYGRLYRGDFDGEEYGENGGPLVFALPQTGDGTDAELAWGDGSWTLPETVVQRLEDPLPSFSVSLDGPETAGDGSDLEITVGVTNEGDSAGRYVFALNRQGPQIASTPVGRIAGELEPGASETHTFDAVPPDDRNGTGYFLQVPGERDSLDHYIEPADDS
ncbi:hypothetical protein [Haloarcula salinisoli]|uniref:CARDB protein n=1 Tax=Haloarcula salinisoli TaxID=2487746 RepID=A0A8J7YIA7_9EURY|nr:hypothetical protein [Halomicroarcula salinisoli]MBX0284958.1 hypothetical protein [Halomicroarcula salinisoli]MBX0303564.1 hypothetical protein [Halomicroarcula salinisoli]